MIGWISDVAAMPEGGKGLLSAALCLVAMLICFICTYVSHSLVVMAAACISFFAFASICTSLYSMSVTQKVLPKFSFGLARVPVLAVFSTTLLAQLFAIFTMKESFEHLLSPNHHGGGGHDVDAAGHGEHHGSVESSWSFYVSAASSSFSLLLVAYPLVNQPFQYVLTAASSSTIQEHAADIANAVCWAIPGLSRLLLPRINAMVLMAWCSSFLILVCDYFRLEYPWVDPICCIILSAAMFSTMGPLSIYTGKILLQTAPSHLLNQLDRCISEASTIDGVLELRTRYFWQLDFTQLVGVVEVRVRRDADEQAVLASVYEKLSAVVSLLTVQITKDTSYQSPESSVFYPAAPSNSAVDMQEKAFASLQGGDGSQSRMENMYNFGDELSKRLAPFAVNAPPVNASNVNSAQPPTQPPAYVPCPPMNQGSFAQHNFGGMNSMFPRDQSNNNGSPFSFR